MSLGIAKAHTATVVPCTASIRIGQNVVHDSCSRLNSSVTSTFLSLNLLDSLSSWLKAFTTRMPGIVSESTSVTLDHFRHARMKKRFMCSPCLKIAQQNSGTGTTITSPSRQSRLSSTALSPSSMTAESDTSTIPNARKSQSLSVSELTRVMRLPVFFLE